MADGKGCDNCAYKVAESVDGNGNRIVNCEKNEYQMYAPLVDDCKHHSKKLD